MWEIIVWVSNECIMLEVIAQGIIHSFLNALDNDCHPLLRDAPLLKSLLTQLHFQHTWRKGICASTL